MSRDPRPVDDEPYEPGWQPSDWTVAPAEYMREEMAARGWGAFDVAKACGMTEPEVVKLLEGGNLYERTAERLARGLGTSAALWLALEARFRADLAAGKVWADDPNKRKGY